MMKGLKSVCTALAVVTAAGTASAETTCTLKDRLANGAKVEIDDGQGNWTIMRAYKVYAEKGGFESYQLLHDRGSTMPLYAGLRDINVSRDGEATLYGDRFKLTCR